MTVEQSDGGRPVPDDPAAKDPRTTARAEETGEGAVNDTEARYGDNESPA